MRSRHFPAFFLALIFILTGCNSTKQVAPAPALRTYNGTASVGDFLTISLNSTAQTISYSDVSNSTTGTVPYTVNSDGSYTLADPNGNLLSAYEVPNYALLIEAAKTGPNSNSPALITAVESGPISLATFEGQAYNYMQFRTSQGGVDIGSVSISSQGLATTSSYWPYGAVNAGDSGMSPFNGSTMDFSQAKLDSSGTFLYMPDIGNSAVNDYAFGTANGMFIVDTPNGAILGLKKAASKDFDPSFAGNYKGLSFQKTNVTWTPGVGESGTTTQDGGSVVVSSTGQVTILDSNGNQIAQSTLTPVADASYLYDGTAATLQDPCFGLFTFRITTATSQQDIFISFLGNAVVFSEFGADLPWGNGGTYSYAYGVAIK